MTAPVPPSASQDGLAHKQGCPRSYPSRWPGKFDRCTCGAVPPSATPSPEAAKGEGTGRATRTTTYGVSFPDRPGWDFGKNGANEVWQAAICNGGTPTVTVIERTTHTLPEWCPIGSEDEPHMHCGHWSECEPCHRCGDDTPDPDCDCDRCTSARPAAAPSPHPEGPETR